MSDTITISPAEGTWVVRAGGSVLGESTGAKRLEEEGYDDVIYFPREDIATEFLDRTDTRSACPKKGDATYFSVVTKSTTLRDIAWSYEDPYEGVAQIAGHIAFYAGELVTVEHV